MKEIINLHNRLFHVHSPFRHMAICAIIIGVGDLLCVIGDLIWLFGDMYVQTHPHHFIVLGFLSVATLVISASFFWLYLSISKYLVHHEAYMANKKAKAGLRRVK